MVTRLFTTTFFRSNENTVPSNTRLLLVDDNLFNRRLLQKIFSQIGYSCCVASNIDEAMAMASQEKFDMILIKSTFPAHIELAQFICFQASQPNLADSLVIAMTYQPDTLPEEVNRRLSLPITANNLISTMRRFESEINSTSCSTMRLDR